LWNRLKLDCRGAGSGLFRATSAAMASTIRAPTFPSHISVTRTLEGHTEHDAVLGYDVENSLEWEKSQAIIRA
jgi:hypothetical protein